MFIGITASFTIVNLLLLSKFLFPKYAERELFSVELFLELAGSGRVDFMATSDLDPAKEDDFGRSTDLLRLEDLKLNISARPVDLSFRFLLSGLLMDTVSTVVVTSVVTSDIAVALRSMFLGKLI